MGNLQIPRNLNNSGVLFSLKKEIESYKEKHLQKIATTNTLVGQKFNLNEIKNTANNTIPIGEAL